MAKFPTDAPISKVIKSFESLGFRLVREGSHTAMVRENPDGTRTPLTMPNHWRIKGSTLRTILTQSGISREKFLKAYRVKLRKFLEKQMRRSQTEIGKIPPYNSKNILGFTRDA